MHLVGGVIEMIARFVLLLALLGCRESERCTADSDCLVEEFCNSAAICQQRAACRSNADCPAEGTFCESGSGRCLVGPGLELGSPCSSAAQCPYGAICVEGRCEPGCYGHGDCLLGEQCIGGQCRADDGACAAIDFCAYGALCEGGRC